MGESDKYCAQCGTLAPGATPAPAATPLAAPPVPQHYPIGYFSPRLTRSLRNRKIAGVCGGIARYFEVDPTIVRVLFVAMFFCPILPAIIPYIVCWIVMPLEQPDPMPAPHAAHYSGAAPMGQPASYAPMPR